MFWVLDPYRFHSSDIPSEKSQVKYDFFKNEGSVSMLSDMKLPNSTLCNAIAYSDLTVSNKLGVYEWVTVLMKYHVIAVVFLLYPNLSVAG